MKRLSWQWPFGATLLILSVVLYGAHYLVFHDAHHVFIYLLGDIDFVPLEVLLVTLVIHRVLQVREKRAAMKKMNMVIGAFFSEVGTELLSKLLEFVAKPGPLCEVMKVDVRWNAQDYTRAGQALQSLDYDMGDSGDLDALRSFLQAERTFLVTLLENPILLEHDVFTDMLWAVTHLGEELAARGSLANLPEQDARHLAGDIKRAFTRLLQIWLKYIQHLQKEYPYLFSLATRMNPFDENACATVGAPSNT